MSENKNAKTTTDDGHVAHVFSLDREDILKANIEKLRKRYGEKYTNAAAIARADK